jgi:hypothetical protein
MATPGALAALEKAGQGPGEFLARHANRECGNLPDEDRMENGYKLEDCRKRSPKGPRCAIECHSNLLRLFSAIQRRCLGRTAARRPDPIEFAPSNSPSQFRCHIHVPTASLALCETRV